MTPEQVEAAARAVIEPVFGPCTVTIEPVGAHFPELGNVCVSIHKKPSPSKRTQVCEPLQGDSLWDFQR